MEAVEEGAFCRWQEGNTTARHGGRIAAALDAWLADGLVGKPGSTSGARWADAARASLDRKGMSESKTNDISAAVKLLGALERYGFLRAKLAGAYLEGEMEAWNESSGQITPAGERLIAAWRRDDMAKVGECLLAAMALRVLPSPLEKDWERPSVNPIGLTAAVLLALEAMQPDEAFLAVPEFVRFVQTADGSTCPHSIAEAIIVYREAKTRSADHRVFEEAALVSVAGAGQRAIKPASLTSYADVAFRWYEDTGVFVIAKFGRKKVLRLAQRPDARCMAAALARGPAPEGGLADPLAYLTRLEAGELDRLEPVVVAAEMELRQRDTRRAAQALRDLLGVLDRGEGLARTLRRVPAHDATTLAREQETADNPMRDWPAVRELLVNLSEDADLGIEGIKPSAAMEWALFRALLLLVGPGGLETPAAKARRFKIAADLLPVGTAAGGGADIEMRCRGGFLLAGEATLTAGSRQATTEGESVRRHVAELVRTAGASDRVVGVFVAPTFDLNTLEWFRQGSHWIGTERVSADIVPLKIDQLVSLCDAAVRRGGGTPAWFRGVLDRCLERRDFGELPWLNGIAEAVEGAGNDIGGATGPVPTRPSAAVGSTSVAVRRQAHPPRAKGQGSLFDLHP